MVNPALYAGSSSIARDITIGENKCVAGGVCCSQGKSILLKSSRWYLENILISDSDSDSYTLYASLYILRYMLYIMIMTSRNFSCYWFPWMLPSTCCSGICSWVITLLSDLLTAGPYSFTFFYTFTFTFSFTFSYTITITFTFTVIYFIFFPRILRIDRLGSRHWYWIRRFRFDEDLFYGIVRQLDGHCETGEERKLYRRSI